MSRQSPAETTPGPGSALGSKRKGRLVVGALGLLLGVWFSWYTWANVPMGTQDRPGAGVFPLAIGLAMVGVSLLTLAEAWFTDRVTGNIRMPQGTNLRRMLVMAGAVLAFVALYQFLGQYIASTLFMITALSVLGTRSPLRNVVYGAAIGIGISAFFMELLAVRLPEGLLGPTGLIGGLFL